MRFAITAILLGLWAVLSSGCGSDVVYRSPPASSGLGEDGEIIIYDITGKAWDVTHAAQKYGMDPSRYEYGAGPFAITPIMNAKMLSPGDSTYPRDTEDFLVIGTSLNGFTRAYPTQLLGQHEIANEQFGDAHVAVAF